MGFNDPDGKDYREFERVMFQIRRELLPKIEEIFIK